MAGLAVQGAAESRGFSVMPGQFIDLEAPVRWFRFEIRLLLHSEA